MLEPAGYRSGTFSDLDIFVRKFGFDLYDLDIYRFARSAMPQPFLYNFVDHNGSFYEAQTVRGQASVGDALFFRDPIKHQKQYDLSQVIKRAAFFEIYGLPDCAAELLLASRNLLDSIYDIDQLLDLLTPAIKGKRRSYAEYMAAFKADPAQFYPSDGSRYPEDVISQYDGVFVPAWELNASSVGAQASDSTTEESGSQFFSWLWWQLNKVRRLVRRK